MSLFRDCVPVCFVAVAFVGLGCGSANMPAAQYGTPEAVDDAWSPVTDPGTGFSVEIPGAAETEHAFDDEGLESFAAWSDSAQVIVMEHAETYPLEGLDARVDAIFDTVVEPGAVPSLEWNEARHGYPVRQATFLEGGRYYHVSIFAGRSYFYIVSIAHGSTGSPLADLDVVYRRMADSISLPEWDRPTPESRPGWQLVHPVSSPWAVQMPGPVEFPEADPDLQYGEEMTVVSASDVESARQYSILWIPSETRPNSGDFDRRIEAWTQQGYRLEGTRYGAVHGCPARRHELRTEDRTVHVQMFAVDGGLYEMRVQETRVPRTASDPDVERFMNSFEFAER